MPQWISLEEAEREGLDLSWVFRSIGPRRKGVVYLNLYWRTVSTVTGVLVCVHQVRSGRTGRVSREVRGWQVSEYGPDDIRDRTHTTAWEYGP